MKGKEHADLVGIYREAFPGAAQLVNRLGGTREQAKDLFHDALLIYLERKAAGTLTVQTSVNAYLLGITKILWLHSRSEHFTALPEEVESYVEEEWRGDQEEKKVLDYLVMAGQKCMQLLKAFYYDGLSLSDIATHFGFNGTRSATVQKYKCLEKVRTEVKKRNIHEEAIY